MKEDSLVTNYDFERLAHALRDIAVNVTKGGYIKTAIAIGNLSLEVAKGKIGSSVESFVDQVIECAEEEWMVSSYKKKVHEALSSSMSYDKAIDKMEPRLEKEIGQLVMIFKARSTSVMKSLDRIIANTSDQEQKFLLASFRYIISYEGIFDQSMRALFILVSMAKGKPVTFENERSMPVLEIKKHLAGLIGESSTEVIFEGYNNHLRNSIGHANFTYDSAKLKTVFEDHDPIMGGITWGPISLTLDEFVTEYLTKLDVVANYVTLFGSLVHVTRISNFP